MIEIKYKKVSSNASDLKFSEGDVGVDLSAVEEMCIEPGRRGLVKTGIKINMPEIFREKMMGGARVYDGWNQHNGTQTLMAKIEGRSGLALNKGVFPIGGIIDPSYHGEIGVVLFNSDTFPFIVKPGDRIAQLVFYTCLAGQQAKFVEDYTEWQKTTRAENGFGHSGM